MAANQPLQDTPPSKPLYSPKGEYEKKEEKEQVKKGPALTWLAARDAPIALALLGVGLYIVIAVFAITLADKTVWILLGASFVFGGVLFLAGEFLVRAVVREASGILFGPYGVEEEKAAYDLLYDYLFTREAPIILMNHGEVDKRSLESPLIKMGFRGPGYVKVDTWTAILIQTALGLRVECAGQHFLTKTDQVRGFVDLALQRYTFSLENAHTKDNIPLRLGGTCYFRIVQDSSRLRRHLKRVPREDAVRLAVMTTTDWKLQTQLTTNAKIRDAIAQFNFNDIHRTYPDLLNDADPSVPLHQADGALPRIELQEKLRNMVDAAVRTWGVEVVAITVDEIYLPDDVKKTLKDAWAAAWQHKVAYEKADVNARIDKRQAEGKRDAAEIERVANIERAFGEAESKNITTRAEAERERLLAEAHAEAQRLTGTARTEVSVEFVRRIEEILHTSNLPTDPASLKEFLSLFKVMFPEGQADKRKTKDGREGRDGDSSSTNESRESA